MTFPAARAQARGLLAGILVPALVTGWALGTGVSAADEGPPLHAVTYTVFSETPFRNAEIYFREVDPPNFADYSHDPYVFSPNVEADLGPEQTWTREVMLANPDDWAMVVVSSLDSPKRPNFHCVLAVDGQVVATNQGPKGAFCSLQNS